MYRVKLLNTFLLIGAKRKMGQMYRNASNNLLFSTKSRKAEIIDTEPIKYSQSAANTYKAETTRTGISGEPRLWYEPYVVLASLTVFMLYFTVIREENDLDQELNRSLYSRISGLEEHQLKLSLEYNEQRGLETKDIIKRLNEINDEKSKVDS